MMTKVIEWIEIEAPREDIYDIVMDPTRRMQLSPLYGTTLLKSVSPDYPQEGSTLRMSLREEPTYEYDVRVIQFVEGSKLTYQLAIRRGTTVTWIVQNTDRGLTRVIYEEEFSADKTEEEAYIQSVQESVRSWLKNIKFYAELRDSRLKIFLKWIMDSFFLKLRNDQRKVILILVFMQFAGIISFIMAAIALGIARFIGQ